MAGAFQECGFGQAMLVRPLRHPREDNAQNIQVDGDVWSSWEITFWSRWVQPCENANVQPF